MPTLLHRSWQGLALNATSLLKAKEERGASADPVWFVEYQGNIHVRTNEDTGKVKRIRRNPHVRIAPSSVTWVPKKEWTEAEALMGGEERRRSRLDSSRRSRAYNID